MFLALSACSTSQKEKSSEEGTTATRHPVFSPSPHIYNFIAQSKPQAHTEKSAMIQYDIWQETVDLDIKNMPLTTLLTGLSQRLSFNYSIAIQSDKAINYQGKKVALSTLFNQVAAQIDMRAEFNNDSVVFLSNAPYWKSHSIPILNMQRQSASALSFNQNINSALNTKKAGTEIHNQFKHQFWEDIQRNTERLVGNKESVIVNPEAGLITALASQYMHIQLDQYISQIVATQKRQVILDVAIIEIELSEDNQQGIQWNAVLGNNTLSQNTPVIPSISGQLNTFINAPNADLSTQISWFNQFGSSKVLSSPQLQVINNQTAVLKVVDNLVYFTIDSITSLNQNTSVTNFNTKANTIPVGLILSLTPFIEHSGMVTLNIRPILSRMSGVVRDPHPLLADRGVVSEIPIIQERELESVLRVKSGEIAIIAGLIQQSTQDQKSYLPYLQSLGNKQNGKRNTELVIFIRPTVLEI